jgi:hypothetical protein
MLSILGTLVLFAGIILHSLREILLLWVQPTRNAVQRQSIFDKVMQFASQRRPLVFYSGPGTALLLAGVAWGIRVMYIFRQSQALAVGSALICMMLCVVGSLSILAGIILHLMHGILKDLAQAKQGK